MFLSGLMGSRPFISIIVVAYNMERELPRTLFSLSRKYQRDIDGLEYEVIIVDNGSDRPFDRSVDVKSFGKQFHFHYIENASPSPVEALNFGATVARGRVLCFMIDGARILSPGVLSSAWAVFTSAAYKQPTVSVTGFHIGPELQNDSSAKGYNQLVEDELLKELGWRENGYRLFEISVFAGSCRSGWFGDAAESNAIFVCRSGFNELGGFDEGFNLPGGGLANLDFYYRAVMRKNSKHVVLLGEGTFHQIHGGIATNADRDTQTKRIEQWRQQYLEIRGKRFVRPAKQSIYHGVIDPAAVKAVKKSIESVV